MLVEDMTSAILNPTPTGARNSLVAGDNYNPGDSRIAFSYGPGKSTKKKRKRDSKSKKKVVPFTRPPIQGFNTGANYSGSK